METILEQQRRYHEEKERLMDVMAKEMLAKKSTLRDQINSDHRTRAMQDVSVPLSASLWARWTGGGGRGCGDKGSRLATRGVCMPAECTRAAKPKDA